MQLIKLSPYLSIATLLSWVCPSRIVLLCGFEGHDLPQGLEQRIRIQADGVDV